MYNKPIINEPVRFSYSMNNLNEKKHFNIMKRPLSGIKRNNVLKRLCDEKMTVNWRREHVSENLNNHKLYLLDVLCKSRQEYKDKTQFKEMSSEKNVLESLLCLKYEEYYYSSIHKIGLDPVYIFYCTPTQTIIFNDYIRKQKHSKLYIDAAGHCVKKLKGLIIIFLVIYFYIKESYTQDQKVDRSLLHRCYHNAIILTRSIIGFQIE